MEVRAQSGSPGESFFSPVWQIPKRLSASCLSWLPCDSTSERMKRIHERVDSTFQRAQIREVQIPNMVPELHNHFDHLLSQNGVKPDPSTTSTAEVGEVASLGDLGSDPEVTRAPLLQDRVNATDWKKTIASKEEELINKLTVFTTLIQLRNRCGIPEENNLKIMSLVKEAFNKPITVWELFTSNYQLTFFQKLKAAWFYWIYYQTSLITNIIEAYLGKLIDRVTNNLVKDSSDARTKIFRAVVNNTHQFLLEDLRATKNFAYEREPGSLEQCRSRAIEKHYGFSLSQLCSNFSESLVDRLNPRVRVLKNCQEIPILGSVFKLFEGFVNRFIIQKIMIQSVLPLSLESLVKNGLEATQPDKLPFAIGMTQLFTSLFEKLRIVVEDTRFSPSPHQEEIPPGTEWLRPTIKLFLDALEIEGNFTPLELRKKLAQIETGKKGLLTSKIASQIEQGIIDSGNLLFWQLHKMAQSGELLAHFLNLSLAPFSWEVRDEKELLAQFNEEKVNFERVGESVFKKLVEKSVSKQFDPQPKDPLRGAIKQQFSAQKVLLSGLIDKIRPISAEMSQKVERASEGNSVKEDIVALSQVIKALANRQEFQKETEELDSINRNEMDRSFGPFFKRLEEIQDHLLKLQEAQDYYSAYVGVTQSLSEIQTLLTAIREQAHSQQYPLIQSLENLSEEIAKHLGSQAPLVLKLKRSIGELSDLSTTIAREQKAIDAIHALYPPQQEETEGGQGLLDQLLNYERGIYPQGFKPRVCLEEIGKQLTHLLPEEKRELELIIKNGSQLRSKWGELSQALQRIYERHHLEQVRSKALFEQSLNTMAPWTQEKLTNYHIVKEQDFQKMRSEMRIIADNIEALHQDRQHLKPDLTMPISDTMWQLVSGLASFAGTHFGGPIVGAPLAALGGVKWQFMQGGDSGWISPAVKAIGAAGSCLGGAFLWRPLWTLGTFFAGRAAVETGKNIVRKDALHQVLNILSRGYKFVLRQKRIYEAATTRFLQTASEVE